jgi:hypothetical protein|tara:strand:- start:900 stop:1364 length:465 start_codon:yes stop_codon:yes gene_type:complete
MNNQIKLAITAIIICCVIALIAFVDEDESLKPANNKEELLPPSNYEGKNEAKLSWFRDMLSDNSASQSKDAEAPLPPHLNSTNKRNPNEVSVVIDESLIVQRESEIEALIEEYDANLDDRESQIALQERFKEVSADYKQQVIAKVRQLNTEEGN